MSITIIHLTDIHMLTDANKNIILSRKQQLYDACCSVLSKNDSAILVVSGDIAFSGKAQEYDNAFDLISFLQDKLDAYLESNIRVLVSPGNHDCDFDQNTALRERVLSTFDSSLIIDEGILASANYIQNSFFEFSEYFDKYDSSKICNLIELELGSKKLFFQMINTAWMSKINEEPGRLIVPQNALEDVNTDKYDCVFTIMHHPDNWLHPDNRSDFLEHIRKTTDVLIIGHEHRKDSYTSQGNSWSITEFHGKELQGSNENSSFSIYQFDEGFQNVRIFDFSWDTNIYKRNPDHSQAFTRNTLTSSLALSPSKEYMNRYIDDPGMIIVHENASDVRLSEIYCWPDLEQVEVQDTTVIIPDKRIDCNIKEQLLMSSISVVIGDSLSGKSSLAKMLFRGYSQQGKCCVLMKGEELNTTVEANLKDRICSIFTDEYSVTNLERYRQLSPDKRILIIDDFNNTPYHDERRSKILSHLSQFASNIIILSDNELEARVICSKLPASFSTNVGYYRICNYGNTKRYEFISKWYYLRDEYANGDSAVEERITNAHERINLLLGSTNGFIPATPIYLINLLQNMDAFIPASFSGSQYGFLYESLINKSMFQIKRKISNQGELNIYINIVSLLAFRMLKSKSNTFSRTELCEIAQAFSIDQKITVNSNTLLDNMIESRLIQEVGPNTLKFRYPYAFYYFSGRYIAYHLNNSEVTEQIDYMSKRLYSEQYGNIIIFVCHFANNKEIIENILLIAYSALENYDVFDFDKHVDVFDKAKRIMDNIFDKNAVGEENDVDRNRSEERIIKDKLGLQDGSIHEPEEDFDEVADREKDLASLSAAMRTLDVLGQIIMNYPGDIAGDMKISIIDEIHKLGMRITEAVLSTLGILQREYLEYLVDYVKDKKNIRDPQEIVRAVENAFSWLVAGMTCGMVRKISALLNNDALLIAVQETFSLSSSISQKLVLVDLQLNILKKPNFNEIKRLADEFEKSRSTQFANSVLRSMVAEYLKYNKCGYEMRSQLCDRFKLSDKIALIEGSKNRDR